MNANSLIPLLVAAAGGFPAYSSAQDQSSLSASPDAAITVAQATASGPPVLSQPAAAPPRSAIELYTSRHHLSAGYGDWREVGVRGSFESGIHRWQGELASMRRFNQSGNYAGIGDTVTLGDDWSASISAGAGDGAFYLPRYRVDGFVNRKFLPDRNLIGTLGAGYYKAPDGHIDRNMSLGGTYYFSQPWVVQGEVRFNNSSPGNIRTRQQFLATTWGLEGQTQVIGRYAWGTEGYQTIAQGASLINFRSNEASIKVRQWLGPKWGVEARVERYRNPFYVRNGVNVGFFWQFQ